ncbi:putative two-component histidine kinase [Sphingomonas changbaiensis NBRC 104936]|uniref:histidine kinase n=1 Tax=Sphingomonas changbaiensis NBRC 104936 TaxID=1219043 RepID=A0A0E9MK12_9SPHN|nr:ATP-binding protein [Sphingomonas changbaiensis]GAO37864.1 putative two-component histidine kinase [Sphingomonas changbaiensis NBRC 104936]
MSSVAATTTGTPDLDIIGCEQEPIRIPGSIQPQGALLVLDPVSQVVMQAAIGDRSALADDRGAIGRPIKDVLTPGAAAVVQDLDAKVPPAGSVSLGALRTGATLHHLVAHRSGGMLILELERASETEPRSFDEVYPHVRDFLDDLQHANSIEDVASLAAREVRRITGLDRTMVYQFDEAWNGTVIAEDRNDRLPSYLDLRFPASDIPAQARELYRLNRLRLIADATYTPVPIEPVLNPKTGAPVDLSHSILRSVSPVHLEYMRNMGTMASMSISLLRDGQLWGLISCHNRDATQVGYHIRTACDFIGQVVSMQIAAKESAALAQKRSALQTVQSRLLAQMAAAGNFVTGLLAGTDDLLALTGAAGAAIVSGDTCTLVGETPSEGEVSGIVDWLAQGDRRDIVVSDSLAGDMPGAERIKDQASGLLAISISQLHDSYLLWFRPEVIRTISWGGDPRKRAELDPQGLRLHPRKSFESWQETVRLKSRPWEAAEVEAATALRTAIVDIVLRNAEERAELTERLVSINKELEAFSYSVSHDLRAPFRHIVGYAQLLKKYEGDRLTERGDRYIDTIVESAISAGTLVDDLLSYSQMGRASLRPIRIDMNMLVDEVKRALLGEEEGRTDWTIAKLPSVMGDATMLRLVWQNLLENALKFSRERDEPTIEIGATDDGNQVTYFVRDNGTGFDMAYVGKLFGVFQRLHRVEEFEGTGIGLANVKRIVERHGGQAWAEGTLNGGATFFFALPKEVEVE